MRRGHCAEGVVQLGDDVPCPGPDTLRRKHAALAGEWHHLAVKYVSLSAQELLAAHVILSHVFNWAAFKQPEPHML